MSEYKWIIGQRKAETLMDSVLRNRGVSPMEAEAFLQPNPRDLHDPFLIARMDTAAARIVTAIKAKEKIAVYGDYDVDGVTGTVTLMNAIKMYGGTCDYYIPGRGEGYGLHAESLEGIIERGATLIISVDCGITAVEEAKVCKAKGIDLIITDHHEWKSILPDCYAIVHPRIGEMVHEDAGDYVPSKYPNPDICGSGVAWKVAVAIGRLMNDGKQVDRDHAPYFSHALALTALGTIADVVPLVGENRTIAHYGMSKMANTVFDGLRALIASARFDGQDIDGYKIAFSLAPRLNAAGRMGHASQAVRMLASTNYTEALEIAERLEQSNKERQAEERKIVKEAEAIYERQRDSGVPSEVIVVECGGWHPGVIGIVASRLAEKYHRPALVFKGDGASGRSISGYNLVAAVGECAEHLTRYGGHAAACGLHIKEGHLKEFREAICTVARRDLTPEMLTPTIKVEFPASVDEITEKVTMDLKKIGPFGNGNRRPLFVFRKMQIVDVRTMGKEGQFISFIAKQQDESSSGEIAMKFVSFKPNDLTKKLIPGMTVDVVAEPDINEWKGNTSVQLMVRDVKLWVAEGVELLA